MKLKSKIPDELVQKQLSNPPLLIKDPPDQLPEITQDEIGEFLNALHTFRLARAHFEANRAAITMKLLRVCRCEEGDYFALLDEHDNLVVEDNTSVAPGTGRPITFRDSVPSSGAA